MRRPLIILGVIAGLAAIASVGGALALGSNSSTPRDRAAAIPPLGAGLVTQMQLAEARGPYSITCETAADGKLTCSPIRDQDVIPALKAGNEVYGRTVIAFPGGAKVKEDSGPAFVSTDLVCSAGTNSLLMCSRVTSAVPTVRAGADVFAFYRKHDVTFDNHGQLVSHVGAPTVELRVLPVAR
jgi:hypothetical protein